MAECFATADFYTANLERLGHEAKKIVPNCNILQQRWLTERSLTPSVTFDPNQPLQWQFTVLAAQIRHYRPDILYIYDINWVAESLLRAIRPYVRLIVGQNACPLRPNLDLGAYDLLLTSFPHYVEKFRSQGANSEYFRIGFGKKVLDRLGTVPLSYDTTFIGGYSPHHRRRIELLERASRQIPMQFWGYGATALPPHCAIRQNYRGEVWGLEMYRILSASKITLNLHIDVAGSYANNMRLYEATGVGTCLVTDAKVNLHDLFEVGKEVVAYSSPEDCIEKIRYLLDNEAQRAAIARAGQARTLREHTYDRRMEELVEILERYLKGRSPSANGNNMKLQRYHAAIFRNPDDAQSYQQLGDFLRDRGKLEAAHRAYQRATSVSSSALSGSTDN